MSITMPVLCTLQIDGGDTVSVSTPYGDVSAMTMTLRFDDLYEGHATISKFMKDLVVKPFAGLPENIPFAVSTQELINAHNEVNSFGDSLSDIFASVEEGSNMVTLPFMINECLLVSLTLKATGVVSTQEKYSPNEDAISWYMQCTSRDGDEIFQIPNGDSITETPSLNIYLGTFDTYRELSERIMGETIRVSAATIEENRAIVNSLHMLRIELMVEVDNFCKVWETDVISIGFEKAIEVKNALHTVTLISTGGPQVEIQSEEDEKFLAGLYDTATDNSDTEV